MTSTLLSIVKDKINSFEENLNELNIQNLRQGLCNEVSTAEKQTNSMKNLKCAKRKDSAKSFISFEKNYKEPSQSSCFSKLNLNKNLFRKSEKRLNISSNISSSCFAHTNNGNNNIISKKKKESDKSVLTNENLKSTVEKSVISLSDSSSGDEGNFYFREKDSRRSRSLKSERSRKTHRTQSCSHKEPIEKKEAHQDGFKEEMNLIQNIMKEDNCKNENLIFIDQPEEIDSHSSVHSSKRGTSDWDRYFENYYIDASENYAGNFDNYLNAALKFLNLLPAKDWTNEINSKKVRLPDHPTNKRKKTLILDLDETLIHSDLDFIFPEHDKMISLENQQESTCTIIPLIFRPGLKSFLEFCREHFEVVVFTASCKDYADTVINTIDPDNRYFSFRLYRESCLFIQPGIYIKDLCIIENRDLKDIIIVDNSLLSFANHLNNGILVSSFYFDKEDTVLNSVIGYLHEMILEKEDVRVVNRETFKFEEFKNEMKMVLHKEIGKLNKSHSSISEKSSKSSSSSHLQKTT
jgi:Dullard-like phosphatase family protein